jgi:exodeoxyribonuclease VII large subunit
LEGRFSQFWVQGEVSNLRRQSSGHVYFSLKDKRSQLPAVMFARDASRQSFNLEDGMELKLFGDLSVYEPHGRYQMIAKIAIQSGEGRLQIEFERLKRMLAAEGLFDADRKRSLPLLPKRIAVVTSPTGAAVQDFIRILRRRNFQGTVDVYPARVQGKEAASEIQSMLARANTSGKYDLIVLTRGGGSIEDLWPFNDEALARAVAASQTPIISAVGHEIDHVLTDFAADYRAEMPSGAAELISSQWIEVLQRLEDSKCRLCEVAETHIYHYQVNLRDYRARLQIIAPARRLELLSMRIDEWESRLQKVLLKELTRRKVHAESLTARLAEHHPRAQLKFYTQTLSNHGRRLQKAIEVDLQGKQKQLSYLDKRHSNSSLQASLHRGFALLEKPDGSIVSQIGTVHTDDTLTARLSDGKIQLKVTHTDAKK